MALIVIPILAIQNAKIVKEMACIDSQKRYLFINFALQLRKTDR